LLRVYKLNGEYARHFWYARKNTFYVCYAVIFTSNSGMGIRGWRNLFKERMEWKRITETAKIHSGL
jgi:hypothetical protein